MCLSFGVLPGLLLDRFIFSWNFLTDEAIISNSHCEYLFGVFGVKIFEEIHFHSLQKNLFSHRIIQEEPKFAYPEWEENQVKPIHSYLQSPVKLLSFYFLYLWLSVIFWNDVMTDWGLPSVGDRQCVRTCHLHSEKPWRWPLDQEVWLNFVSHHRALCPTKPDLSLRGISMTNWPTQNICFQKIT